MPPKKNSANKQRKDGNDDNNNRSNNNNNNVAFQHGGANASVHSESKLTGGKKRKRLSSYFTELDCVGHILADEVTEHYCRRHDTTTTTTTTTTMEDNGDDDDDDDDTNNNNDQHQVLETWVRNVQQQIDLQNTNIKENIELYTKHQSSERQTKRLRDDIFVTQLQIKNIERDQNAIMKRMEREEKQRLTYDKASTFLACIEDTLAEIKRTRVRTSTKQYHSQKK